MAEPEPKRRCIDEGTYAFTSVNVLNVLENEETNVTNMVEDVLQIPQGKSEDVLSYLVVSVCGENDDEYERYGLKLVVNYWLMRCPNASWRWLIWHYYRTNEKGQELATRLQPYAESLTDPTLTMKSVSGVVSTVKQMSALQSCFDVPPGKMKEIEQSTPDEAQRREQIMKYWLSYSPFASWEWLAGSLYYNQEERALKAVKPFVRTNPEPSLTTEHLQKVFDETEDWRWRYKYVFRQLQIPRSKVQQALAGREDKLHNSDPPQSLILAKLFLDSHPAPSWKLVTQALYSEEQWEAAEIVHTKYFKDINLQELCIEAISTFLSDSGGVQSLPLPSTLKCKLTQLIDCN